jgi:dihydroorotase
VLLVTHCEDTPTILANEAKAREQYGEDVPIGLHPAIRSVEACLKSSTRAVGLARRHGTRLHVLHLTTAAEMALFEPGPITAKRITAEVCVHHLWFDDRDYDRLGAQIKCNPAIKTADDRAALRAALREGRIDVIATDHAPHTRAEKTGKYFSAPSGLPLVQHMLPMLLDLCADGVLSLTELVSKAAHNPALLFGIRERGFLREGYWADLAVVDLDGITAVDEDQIRYKCGWSPLLGMSLRGEVAMTVLGGEIVYERGKPTGPPQGRALIFDGNAN